VRRASQLSAPAPTAASPALHAHALPTAGGPAMRAWNAQNGKAVATRRSVSYGGRLSYWARSPGSTQHVSTPQHSVCVSRALLGTSSSVISTTSPVSCLTYVSLPTGSAAKLLLRRPGAELLSVRRWAKNDGAGAGGRAEEAAVAGAVEASWQGRRRVVAVPAVRGAGKWHGIA
jgi:hypothetical protein